VTDFVICLLQPKPFVEPIAAISFKTSSDALTIANGHTDAPDSIDVKL
jgi:hypothetical protein